MVAIRRSQDRLYGRTSMSCSATTARMHRPPCSFCLRYLTFSARTIKCRMAPSSGEPLMDFRRRAGRAEAAKCGTLTASTIRRAVVVEPNPRIITLLSSFEDVSRMASETNSAFWLGTVRRRQDSLPQPAPATASRTSTRISCGPSCTPTNVLRRFRANSIQRCTAPPTACSPRQTYSDIRHPHV